MNKLLQASQYTDPLEQYCSYVLVLLGPLFMLQSRHRIRKLFKRLFISFRSLAYCKLELLTIKITMLFVKISVQ
jgi:hypothetical protein